MHQSRVAKATAKAKFLVTVVVLLSFVTASCHVEEIRQIHLKKIPPELHETVMSLKWGRKDIRTYRIEVDKKTALIVLDPIVMSWFEYRSEKLWSHDFRPWDYLFFDKSQRVVIVQIMPVFTMWDTLAENTLPNGWQPIDKIKIRRDSTTYESVDVNRRPRNNTHWAAPNPGFYGFQPEWFIDGEDVELLVTRGSDVTVVAIPDALRVQLREDFLIIDEVSADRVSVLPTESRGPSE